MKNKRSILVVNDDQLFLQTLSCRLGAKGCLVTAVADGPEAIQKTEETAFDCTLVDMSLLGMNGMETYYQIKKIRPRAKVVITTGYSVDELVEQALSEAVADVKVCTALWGF